MNAIENKSEHHHLPIFVVGFGLELIVSPLLLDVHHDVSHVEY